MEMTPVYSSEINAVGYDPSTQEMQIEFKRGNVYQFINVPRYIYDGILNARSKSQFYSRYVRNRYHG